MHVIRSYMAQIREGSFNCAKIAKGAGLDKITVWRQLNDIGLRPNIDFRLIVYMEETGLLVTPAEYETVREERRQAANTQKRIDEIRDRLKTFPLDDIELKREYKELTGKRFQSKGIKYDNN